MEEEEDAAMESPLPPPGTQHMSPPIHVQANRCNCMQCLRWCFHIYPSSTWGHVCVSIMTFVVFIPSVLSFMCIRTTILFALCKPLRKVSNFWSWPHSEQCHSQYTWAQQQFLSERTLWKKRLQNSEFRVYIWMMDTPPPSFIHVWCFILFLQISKRWVAIWLYLAQSL